MSVVVCTDLLSKELHRHVVVGIVVTSGSLHYVMVAHWPRMPEMWIRVPLSIQYFPFSCCAWVKARLLINLWTNIVLDCNYIYIYILYSETMYISTLYIIQQTSAQSCFNIVLPSGGIHLYHYAVNHVGGAI